MMELGEALRVLQLDPRQQLTPELIRKRYLRLALKLHPDRNHAGDAAERFRALGTAYDVALQALSRGEATRQEAERTQALLSLFLRALAGEDVQQQLEELSAYRPSEQFGVDLTVRFDPRLGSGSSTGSGGRGASSVQQQDEEGGPVDVAAAFRQAFCEDGLTEEGWACREQGANV